MIENVRLISKVNMQDRKQALISILNDSELPYNIFHRKIGNHWIDNIIISFGNQGPKLVIGAHYDNFIGSCGANDNATGVSILIEIAKYLKISKLELPIEIVFFDREEYQDRGSEQYVRENKNNIYAMINLDTCGFGDTILVGNRKNLSSDEFKRIITDNIIRIHCIKIIEKNPGSDDASFETENIPNISICVIPRTDLEIINKIIECECNNIIPTAEMFPHAPEFVTTTHNGKNDSVEIVQEAAMRQVLAFMIDIINNIKSKY